MPEKRKPPKKKLIKLVKNKEVDEYLEWVNIQQAKLVKAKQAIVFTVDNRQQLKIGYWGVTKGDIVLFCETLKHDTMMEDYTNV